MEFFPRVRLFLWKFKNRLAHAFRLIELLRLTNIQKQSCKKCGCTSYYDFQVPDIYWNKLPKKWINSALCINCFIEQLPIYIETKMIKFCNTKDEIL